jgi:4-amino-4-deoxy-L-arabinose transferase-like glycosyltransferase
VTENSHHEPDFSVGRRRDYALVVVMCLVLYLAGNSSIAVWDRDEAWYAETAREMVQSGDYIVPRFNGEPRYRKPVLIYWLIAAAYHLWGDGEFAARFCSGLAGTVTCLITYRLGTRMYDRRVGLAAALMLAVAPFMVVESKLATTDAVLTATLAGAFMCVWELTDRFKTSTRHAAGSHPSPLIAVASPRGDRGWIEGCGSSRGSLRWALGFWFLVGVSLLTKGPFGPAFLAMAIITWLVFSRQWSVLREFRWLPGLALAAAVVLPWGVAIHVATAGEFFRVALGEQAFGHALRPMNDHRGFPGFYVAVALGGLLPWTMLLPLAFSGVRRWIRDDAPGSFLAGWIVGPLILLELMRTKLPQYYLPAFPAWSLLLARGLIAFHAAGTSLIEATGVRRTSSAISVLSLVATSVAVAFAFRRLPVEVRVPTMASVLVLGLGAIVTAFLIHRTRDRLAWSSAVATSWSFGLVVAAWLTPSAAALRVARASAEVLREQTASDAPVVLFSYREPSLVYYLGRPVPTFGSVKELLPFLNEHGTAFTLLRDADIEKLRKAPDIVVERRDRIEARSILGLCAPAVTLARLQLHRDAGATALQQSDTDEQNVR